MVEQDIHIHWNGPYTKDEISKFNKKEIDIGLYAIYGTHPLYGIGKLLYIGKTEEQTFADRLKNRGVIEYDTDPRSVQIYLGIVYLDSIYVNKAEKIKEMIGNAEKLLINFLRPSNNSLNINSCEIPKNIRLFNEGAYRDLPPELSSKRLLCDYVAKDEVKELCNELKCEIEDLGDGYGFYIDDNIWIGLDYKLWTGYVSLVAQTKANISDGSWRHNEKYDDPKWYYKPISATNKEGALKVIDELKQEIKNM